MAEKRIGSRGCPNCGSHLTEGVRAAGTRVYWCVTCRHRWEPCTPNCRGYKLTTKPVPAIKGCAECGVPDKIAAYWPEAWRAMARELDVVKQAPLRSEGE